MRQSQRTFVARFAIVGLLGLGMLLAGWGCKEAIPEEGVFPIKVIALTGDKVGIANAKVLINGKLLGKTDKFGTFVGTYSGKVTEWIAIKVVGKGPGNLMKVRSKLKMRKTQNGWVPAEVKVEAFLRPETTGAAGAGLAGGMGDPGLKPTTPGTAPGIAPRPIPGLPRAGSPSPTPRRVAMVPRRRYNNNPAPSNPDPIPRTPAPAPPRPAAPAAPTFNGRYKITVNANVDAVKVIVRGRGARSGYIAQAGSSKVIRYRDKSNPPRPVKVTFLVRRKSWMYKEKKIVKDLTLQYGQPDHSVEATFEKKPPRKISVKANLAGIKIYMNGKAKGEITDPNTPLVLEYEGRRSSVRILFKSPNRKIKPRRTSARVRFKPDQYEYTVEKEFKAPEPVAPRPVAPTPTPPVARLGVDPPSPTPADPPPVRRKTASGIYNITISSNVDGVYVRAGRRRLGFIPQAGGSLSYKHKDRRVPPRSLTFTFKAKDRYAYMKRTIRKKLILEAGREDGYRIEAQFEKRRPITVNCTSNVRGAKVYMNGKPKGEIVSPGQPLALEYTGRPTRRLRIEFRSPNPRVYRPSRIRKTVRIKSGTFTYTVEGNFKEKDVGSKVLRASCFRRARRTRVVTLLARKGTTIVLIGDCNNEQVGRTGNSGKIRVKMPKGSFQRVKAIFPGGASIKKVIEVGSSSSGLSVRLSSGGKRCNISRIAKKVLNKIRLEGEEVACLKKVKKPSPQFFSAQLSLARYYCGVLRRRSQGRRFLTVISRNPRNRFAPYRALQMGIEYGRCRDHNKGIRLLRQAERLINRIPPVDRYTNKKALYRALSQLYEQRYYRRKNAVDLTQALKLMQRFKDIARSSDSSAKAFASKNVKRLKKLVAARGGGLDE